MNLKIITVKGKKCELISYIENEIKDNEKNFMKAESFPSYVL